MAPATREKISAWIPESKRWLFRALHHVIMEAERNGLRLSEGDVIVAALEAALEGFADPSDLSPTPVAFPKKTKTGPEVRRKRVISCRHRDAWLFDCIDKIVQTKTSANLPTSFSFELVRLARNGLMRTLDGAELDRATLRGSDADSA